MSLFGIMSLFSFALPKNSVGADRVQEVSKMLPPETATWSSRRASLATQQDWQVSPAVVCFPFFRTSLKEVAFLRFRRRTRETGVRIFVGRFDIPPSEDNAGTSCPAVS